MKDSNDARPDGIVSERPKVAEGAPAVLAAIVAVNKAIAEQGIAKGDRNAQQGFSFRGVDRVYEAMSGPMAEHGLFSAPEVLSVERGERESKGGGRLMLVYLTVKYTFWCATDGSSVSTTVAAEAMDSGDKATSKAMSVAHRTALLQLSTAPVNPAEPDADTYDVAPPAEVRPDPNLIGWETREDAVAAHAALREAISDLSPDQAVALNVWRLDNGLTGWPLPRPHFEALRDHVHGAGTAKLWAADDPARPFEPMEHVPLPPFRSQAVDVATGTTL